MAEEDYRYCSTDDAVLYWSVPEPVSDFSEVDNNGDDEDDENDEESAAVSVHGGWRGIEVGAVVMGAAVLLL